MYLNIIGFGENGHRVYDSSSQKPLCWPETLSFEAFKGSNYATIKEANLILESILELNDIYIHENYTNSANEIPEKTNSKKKRSSKKRSPKKRRIEESDTEEEENENVILEDDDDLDLEDGEICLDAGEIDDGNGNNDEEFCMYNNGNEIDQLLDWTTCKIFFLFR